MLSSEYAHTKALSTQCHTSFWGSVRQYNKVDLARLGAPLNAYNLEEMINSEPISPVISENNLNSCRASELCGEMKIARVMYVLL